MEDLGSLESTETTYPFFETSHVLHNSIVHAKASTLKHAKVRLVT